jgi:hypothetical protein
VVGLLGVDRPEEEADARPDGPERRGGQDSGAVDSQAEDPELASHQAACFAGYKAAVDAEYRAYAIDQGCDRVEKIEKEIVTPAMRRIEADDPDRHLVGLEFRLKGRERLTEKVTRAMAEQPGLTHENAFATVKDAIRYTFQYPEERYAAAVRADVGRLEAAGFERVDCRNTWTNAEYKGINSRWQVPGSGQRFEVQFHTQASFEAKQETHAAYEKLRSPATPKEEQDKLVEFQRDVTARVPVPPGAADIPDYP